MYHALTSVASGVILILNALMVEATLQGDAQAVLGTPLAMTDYGWKVELSREWDVSVHDICIPTVVARARVVHAES